MNEYENRILALESKVEILLKENRLLAQHILQLQTKLINYPASAELEEFSAEGFFGTNEGKE